MRALERMRKAEGGVHGEMEKFIDEILMADTLGVITGRRIA